MLVGITVVKLVPYSALYERDSTSSIRLAYAYPSLLGWGGPLLGGGLENLSSMLAQQHQNGNLTEPSSRQWDTSSYQGICKSIDMKPTPLRCAVCIALKHYR